MLCDEISITGLDLPAQIGVSEEERAGWQTLQADVRIGSNTAFEDMQDELERTIDYDVVAKALRVLAAERPRLLIETLAAEMAACVLGKFGAEQVTVELRKRILPGVRHVAVRLTRTREDMG